MQLTSWKAGVLALTLTTLASVTACSTSAQKQAQNPNVTDSNGMPGMAHSGMNHSMSMDLGPADADYDMRFIDSMTPHHQGAVEMAKEAIAKSQRPEIKKLSNDIISAQNVEINQMKQWRKNWYPKASKTPMAFDVKMGHMIPMSQQQMQAMMMTGDLGAADSQFDLRFINAMIPHHQGAITMAQDALKKTKQSEIKKMAQDIIVSQQKEIDQMKQWRQAWYKQ
ncbi:MAG: DUF305 domain-containing protein [Coleofasciculaceae cyanobacterium]